MRVRIYPNSKQKQTIDNLINKTRIFYNHALATKIEVYEKTGIDANDFDLNRYFSQAKHAYKKYMYLKKISTDITQVETKNVIKAFQSFYCGGGYPKFKSNKNPKQSFSILRGVRLVGVNKNKPLKKGGFKVIKTNKILKEYQDIELSSNLINFPRIGDLKMKGFRNDMYGKIKTSTIVRENGEYYLSMVIEMDEKETIKSVLDTPIGVDVGVKVFAYTSDKREFKQVDLESKTKKIEQLQKRLSAKDKDSKGYIKMKKRLAKAHKDLINARNYFIHETTKELSTHSVVAVENLKIKNMSKSARGTIEEPKKSSSKRGLNRVILKQGWAIFFNQLEYKLADNGGELIKVNPKYTSQTCSQCGYRNKNNRLSQSKFVCKKCGYSTNADYNASVNILTIAI